MKSSPVTGVTVVNTPIVRFVTIAGVCNHRKKFVGIPKWQHENSEGRDEVLVPKSSPEILNLLKQELAFLERGGYGGALPWRPVSIFLDSPSCPNRLDAEQSTPCPECWLYQFVPECFHQEMSPCHFIALNQDGESVHSMSRQYTQAEVVEAVRGWLRAEIRRIAGLEGQPGRVASGAN
jgi:hypothetical protein